MKAKLIVIALLVAFSCALVAQQQRNPGGRPPEANGPNAQIVSKLSEIVSIRERLAKDYELQVDSWRVPMDGPAEIELAEARIDLARERGQDAAVIAELRRLVAAHERRAKRMAALAKDRIAAGEADRAQAGVLEAQVRLLRAQK